MPKTDLNWAPCHVPGPCQEGFSLAAGPVYLSFVSVSWAEGTRTVMDRPGNIAVDCEWKTLRSLGLKDRCLQGRQEPSW